MVGLEESKTNTINTEIMGAQASQGITAVRKDFMEGVPVAQT